LTFFINADFDQNDGAWNFNKNELFNPLTRKVEFAGILGGFLRGLGFSYKDRLYNRYTFNTKLTNDMTSPDQIVFSYRTSVASSQDYSQFWNYRADSSGMNEAVSSQAILQWNHFFGQNALFRISLGRLSNENRYGVGLLLPSDYTWAYSMTDPNDDAYGELGSSQGWSRGTTRVWTAKVDYQADHPRSSVKTGWSSTTRRSARRKSIPNS
jgi:hypothetical protein